VKRFCFIISRVFFHLFFFSIDCNSLVYLFVLLIFKFSSYLDQFCRGVTYSLFAGVARARLDFYDARGAFLKGFMTSIFAQAHFTTDKRRISRIPEYAVSDCAGTRKRVEVCGCASHAYESEYVDAEGLGGGGGGLLSQNRGGTPTRRDDWDGRGGQ